jgi:hypothetical protein
VKPAPEYRHVPAARSTQRCAIYFCPFPHDGADAMALLQHTPAARIPFCAGHRGQLAVMLGQLGDRDVGRFVQDFINAEEATQRFLKSQK